MLDRDADPVPRQVVADDLCLVAVPAPHAVFVPVGTVGHEGVPRERRLDPVGRGEAEVVPVEEVVVGAAGAAVHRALTRPQEYAVAAVGDGVVGDDVPRALLVHQQPGRILAATVEAVAVAPHVEVNAVVHDPVAARAVERDARARVEREVVVRDREAVAAHQHQPVGALHRPAAVHLAAAHVCQVERAAPAQPLVMLVVMVRLPVHQALVLDQAEEAWLPGVTDVVVNEVEVARAARQDADAVAADPGVEDAHVAPALDADRNPLRPVGIGFACQALEFRPGEVHRHIVTADGDHGRIERGGSRQAVGARQHPHRPRDHQPGTERDRRRGRVARLRAKSGRRRNEQRQQNRDQHARDLHVAAPMARARRRCRRLRGSGRTPGRPSQPGDPERGPSSGPAASR